MSWILSSKWKGGQTSFIISMEMGKRGPCKSTFKGGTDSEDNYVTACWNCNLRWRNKTLKEGKPIPEKTNENAKQVNWDGFSSLYLRLNSKDDEWTKLLKRRM